MGGSSALSWAARSVLGACRFRAGGPERRGATGWPGPRSRRRPVAGFGCAPDSQFRRQSRHRGCASAMPTGFPRSPAGCRSKFSKRDCSAPGVARWLLIKASLASTVFRVSVAFFESRYIQTGNFLQGGGRVGGSRGVESVRGGDGSGEGLVGIEHHATTDARIADSIDADARNNGQNGCVANERAIGLQNGLPQRCPRRSIVRAQLKGAGPGPCELQLHFGARRGRDAGIGAFPMDQVGHRMGRAPAADGEIARAQCAVDSRYASGHAIAPPAGSVRRSAGTIGRSILIVAIHAPPGRALKNTAVGQRWGGSVGSRAIPLSHSPALAPLLCPSPSLALFVCPLARTVTCLGTVDRASAA